MTTFMLVYLWQPQAADINTLAEEVLVQTWVSETAATLTGWTETQPQGG